MSALSGQKASKELKGHNLCTGFACIVLVNKVTLCCGACRDLNALFEELVRQSGSISEQEFWAGRQHLLRKQQWESGPQKQRAGIGNAMMLAMRPSADGKTNTVRGPASLAIICCTVSVCFFYHE